MLNSTRAFSFIPILVRLGVALNSTCACSACRQKGIIWLNTSSLFVYKMEKSTSKILHLLHLKHNQVIYYQSFSIVPVGPLLFTVLYLILNFLFFIIYMSRLCIWSRLGLALVGSGCPLPCLSLPSLLFLSLLSPLLLLLSSLSFYLYLYPCLPLYYRLY
jgi:hypothetical protein